MLKQILIFYSNIKLTSSNFEIDLNLLINIKFEIEILTVWSRSDGFENADCITES
jgi:hypothetical protein